MIMKAPAGPPICIRLPPNRAISPPAMIAVKIPCSGFKPLAMANAIDKGKATMPTVIPAKISLKNRPRL